MAGPAGLSPAERTAIARPHGSATGSGRPGGPAAGARLAPAAPQGVRHHRVGSDRRAGDRHRRRHLVAGLLGPVAIIIYARSSASLPGSPPSSSAATNRPITTVVKL